MQVMNAYLVKFPGGFFTVEDAASIASYGRREGFLSLAVSTRAEAESVASVILARTAAPTDAVQVGLEPAATTDTPYLGFRVGDYLTAPDTTGSPELQRVVAVTVTEDEEGNPVYAPELNDVVDTAEAWLDRFTKRLAAGTLNGQVPNASPIALPTPADGGSVQTLPNMPTTDGGSPSTQGAPAGSGGAANVEQTITPPIVFAPPDVTTPPAAGGSGGAPMAAPSEPIVFSVPGLLGPFTEADCPHFRAASSRRIYRLVATLGLYTSGSPQFVLKRRSGVTVTTLETLTFGGDEIDVYNYRPNDWLLVPDDEVWIECTAAGTNCKSFSLYCYTTPAS